MNEFLTKPIYGITKVYL